MTGTQLNLVCPKCTQEFPLIQHHLAGCAITTYRCPCGYEHTEPKGFFEKGLVQFFGGIGSVALCEEARATTRTWYLAEPFVSILGPLGPPTERALACIIGAGIWLMRAWDKQHD